MQTQKNFLGGNSIVRYKNLEMLSSDDRKALLEIVQGGTGVAERVAKTISILLQGDSLGDDTVINLSYLFRDIEESSSGEVKTISEEVSSRIAHIFGQIYLTKDLRGLSGRDATDKVIYWKNAGITINYIIAKMWMICVIRDKQNMDPQEIIKISKEIHAGISLENLDRTKVLGYLGLRESLLNIYKSNQMNNTTLTTQEAKWFMFRDARDNADLAKTLVSRVSIKQVSLYTRLINIMSHDPSYKYTLIDFVEAFKFFDAKKDELRVEVYRAFIGCLRKSRFMRNIIADFSEQYPWISAIKNKISNTELSVSLQKEFTHTPLIVYPGVSDDLLRIARNNTEFFGGKMGNVGGKRSKRGRPFKTNNQ